MSIDLHYMDQRAQFTGMIRLDIDKHSMTFDDGPRRHLGASLIGHACNRYLWFSFRWMFHKVFEPRMLRLFQRGHREEIWLWQMLRACGWTVHEFDPATGEQWRVAAVGGHFGGSLDAIGFPPAHYGIQEWMLLECKTNKSGENGKKWAELEKQGMEQNKPLHWSQSSVYGFLKGIRYSVYFNTNKDDDRMHIEVLELSPSRALHEIRKAEFIILSQDAPPKLHPNMSYWECKYCDAAPICHQSAQILRNCRSCTHASPDDGKLWMCGVHNQHIPDAVIAVGCTHWQGLVH